MLEDLLMVILECGSLDLKILEDCQYDAEDIINDLKAERIPISLNNITDGIFLKGQNELREAVSEKKEEIELEIQSLKEEMENEDDMVILEEEKDRMEAELKKLKADLIMLETLKPEEDMEWFCNCLDTSCWLRRYDTYIKYFKDEVSAIEENMGFSFGAAN